MAQTIKLKRSSTSGRIPTTSDLELGEVAINTYDGKMYIKKSVSGTESIVEIGSGSDGIFEEYIYTATNAQTAFSGSDDNSLTLAYTSGAIQVFLNGILLDPDTDYTATNGTTVTLTSAAATSDLVQIFAFKKKIADGSVTVNTFSGNNSTTAFTLSLDPGDENNTRVFIDGVYQSKSNYSVSGTTLTFSSAPPTGTAIEVEIGNRNVTLDTTANLDFPDDVKLRLGTSQDLEIYHDGSNSYIDDTGTGDLYIRANNLRLSNADGSGQTINTNNGGNVELFHNNSKKFETTSYGADITGRLVTTSHIDAPDSARIRLGDGDDLMFYHDGTHSYVDNNTGSLYISSTASVQIEDNSGNDMITAGVSGAVSLFYNGSNKLSTTSTGVSVTGNIVTDGELRGPATFVIDPAAVGDNTGTVQIKGNLQVDGSTTTINSTTLTVDDLNIVLASGATTAASANGAGITIDGASATLTYDSSNDEWDFNKPIHVGGGITFGTSDSTLADNNLRFKSSGAAYIDHNTVGQAINFRVSNSSSLDITALTISSNGNLSGPGNLTMGSLTSSGTATAQKLVSTDGVLELDDNGTHNGIINVPASLRINIDSDNNNTGESFQIGNNVTNISGSNILFKVQEDGNVGIGTSSPSTTLHVDSVSDFPAITIARSTTSSGLSFTLGMSDFGGGGTDLLFDGVGASTGFGFRPRNSSGSQVNGLIIAPSGDVGIGTTSPQHKLDTVGTIRHTSNIVSNTVYKAFSIGSNRSIDDYGGLYKDYWAIQLATPGASTDGQSSAHGYGALKFSGVSSSDTTLDDVLVLNYNGNVGIGTTNPTVGLQVGNSTSGETKTVIFNSEGGTENGLTVKARTNRAKLAISDNDTTGYVIAENSVLSLGFADTAANANLSIKSGPLVGIGENDPEFKLQLGVDTQSLGAITTNKQILLNIDGGYSSTNSKQYKVAGFVGTTSGGTDDIFGSTYTSGEQLKNFYLGLVSDYGYFNSARFSVVQGGAERVTIAQGGNVGIGTTTPNQSLQINPSAGGYNLFFGRGNSVPGSSDPWLGLFNAGTIGSATYGWGFYDSNSDGSLQIWNRNNSTTGAVALTIKRGGNVGIGTNSPQAKLHVNEGPVYIGDYTGTVSPTEGIFLENTTGNSNTITMYTYGASVFKIESDGVQGNIGWASSGDREVNFVNTGTGDIKVGIGTETPGGRLQVYDAGDNDPTVRITRGLDGGRVQFQYASNTSGFGEIGQTYYGTGRTRIWMGANLESFSTAHSNPTQQDSNYGAWFSTWDSYNDEFTVNRISSGTTTQTLIINSTGVVKGKDSEFLGFEDAINILNADPEDGGTDFDQTPTNNADGGGTTWEISNNGDAIYFSSTSGGHGGTWMKVYCDAGLWAIKGSVRLTNTDGAIHGSTSTDNYKFTHSFRFYIDSGADSGVLKWDADAAASNTGTDFTRAAFAGSPVYMSAGYKTIKYQTNGYNGVQRIYITDLQLVKVG